MKNLIIAALLFVCAAYVTQTFAETIQNADADVTDSADAETTENADAEDTNDVESEVDYCNKNANELNNAEKSRCKSLLGMSPTERKNDKQGERNFAGINFGVGISLTFDTGDNARVKSADIVDGIVRVENEDNRIARVMLESHYFFIPQGRFLKLDSMPPTQWGVGPFVALQPGTEEIIEAVAIGIMVGFRRPDESGASWNVGIGYITDPNVQILGDGFVENQPPPGNETEVRFKETSQDGVVILFSFSF